MCYEANRNTVNCRFPSNPEDDYFSPECSGHNSIEDRVHGTELNGHGLVHLGDLTEERLREHDDTEGFTPMLSYSLRNMFMEGQEEEEEPDERLELLELLEDCSRDL